MSLRAKLTKVFKLKCLTKHFALYNFVFYYNFTSDRLTSKYNWKGCILGKCRCLTSI